MIPNVKDRVLESNGVVSSGMFGISYADSAHIMTILRDTLYSDKILAVLREYASNAWDAHRSVGKGDVPIKVTMPTRMDQTLQIRDYGPGLSHDDVFKIYTQYGASTKRSDDNSVGMLGIGSKSAFAYADSFTITSYHAGMARTYVAALDESEKGIINLLSEEPSDETGVLIQIAVKSSDIYEFNSKAEGLFKYFTPRPEINLSLPDLPHNEVKLANGIIFNENENDAYYYTSNWVAVMGCIPYKINLDQLKPNGDSDIGAAEFLRKMSGVLYFNIGDIQISASREELKYSDSTRKALIDKLTSIVDEYVQATMVKISTEATSNWHKRILLSSLYKYKLNIPNLYSDMSGMYVQFTDMPATCIVERDRKPSVKMSVLPQSRFIIKDDKRPLIGFNLTEHDYVMRPAPGTQLAVAVADFDKYLSSLKIDGITITKLSDMKWEMPRHGSGIKTTNAKHKMSMFRFNYTGFSAPYSKNWESITHIPDSKDVFVVLHNFQPVGSKLHEYWRTDSSILKSFGVSIPDIFGYKTTKTRPVDITQCVGTHYDVWAEQTIKSLLVGNVLNNLNIDAWAGLLERGYYHNESKDPERLKLLEDKLGVNHAITLAYSRHLKAVSELSTIDRADMTRMHQLQSRMDSTWFRSEASIAMDSIVASYPLFAAADSSIECLFTDLSDHWINYIKMCDNS